MGIAILEDVCVFCFFLGGGAYKFATRDLRNDIIIDLHRVGACRAGQRVGVIWVMPKRKEFLFREVFFIIMLQSFVSTGE